MPEGESRFSVPEELANRVFRRVPIRSGLGGYSEELLRQALYAHLDLGSTGTTSPMEAVTGSLLCAYVIASERLAGILVGEEAEIVGERILTFLRLPSGESPQQTFERLLGIAMENSHRINSLLPHR